MALSIIILAAGQGTRMRSSIPKVLHKLAEKSLLEHVVQTASELAKDRIHVVYGHGGDQLKEELSDLKVNWVLQAEQLGTGHAVAQAMGPIPPEDLVLILYGDVPLISRDTLESLIKAGIKGGLGLLTVKMENPTGYGRIIRDAGGEVQRIVEQKDASDLELLVSEVNTGMMTVDCDKLAAWLNRLENNNAQGEFYLTDIIEMAVSDGNPVNTVMPASEIEVMGINDRVQLSEMERNYQLMQAHYLMQQGVTLKDPMRFDLRGDLTIGTDVTIDVNVILEGKVKIGNKVNIGANTTISNSSIDDDVTILQNCVIDNSQVGKASRIGPFTRLRPETVLKDHVHVGNFVEIKKTTVDTGSKISHLSYIGDAEVGKDVNIGAGTITCNYDGANKFKTVIGDRAFIGSDTQLVAPVKVGEGATLGAGTTLTHDAEPESLTISRSKQVKVNGWQRPTKKVKT